MVIVMAQAFRVVDVMNDARIIPLLVFVASGALLVVTTSCKPAGAPVEDTAAFASVTNIVFTGQEPVPPPAGSEQQKKHFTVSAPDEVARILSSIRLQPKEPCACGHIYEATFQKPSGQVHVSFCDHCFDVLGGTNGDSYEGARLYKMPKAFYGEFRRIAETHEKWHVLGP
jgi:hypothetical protein